MPSPLSDSRQVGAREHYQRTLSRERGGRRAMDHFTVKYLMLHRRATDITKRSRSLRRDETPIIRAGIRVKIIERERTRRVRERMRHGG